MRRPVLEPMLRSPHAEVNCARLLHALRLWAETPPKGWPIDGCREAGGAACLERGEAPPHVDNRSAGAFDREERGREQRDARDVDSAEIAQLVRVRARVRARARARVRARARARVGLNRARGRRGAERCVHASWSMTYYWV